MMVLRKKTGWEGLADNPESFFTNILGMSLPRDKRMILLDIVHRSELRVGLVWDPKDDTAIDDAAFAVGLCLWRAATQHRPTIIWCGRRSVASAWIDHCVHVLTKASQEFRNDYKLIRETSKLGQWGILMPNGAWALRYDGAFVEDAISAAESFGNRVDILIGDFYWVDNTDLDAAYDLADEHDAVTTLLIQSGS